MAAVGEAFLPIAELSAYQTKWTIKARVTNKAPVRTFAKGGGEGKVFHVELLDASGGEIRASFFNQGADKYLNMLEKGKCFTFSRGSIKVANKQYNPTSHRYELTFDKDAVVEPSSDDAAIEEIKFNFVTLRAMETRNLPCTVDLCGVITGFKATMSVNSKEGVELVKRDLTIADDTATSMTVTIWGDRAKQEDNVFEGNPVISLKSVGVKEFKESRQGSLYAGGALVFNQDSPVAKRVQQWWTQGGSSQELKDISQQTDGGGGSSKPSVITNIAGMRLASERLSMEPELFQVVARLAIVQTRKQGEPQPLHYMACQEKIEGRGYPCQKRVDASGFCVSCNRAGKVAPRVNIRCSFVDYQDAAWLTSFHEPAIKILGMSAEEIRSLETAAAEKGEAGREELEAVIRKKYFDKPISITVRAKMDSYNGEARANVTVIDASPVKYGEHGRQMLKNIQDILAKEAQAGA